MERILLNSPPSGIYPSYAHDSGWHVVSWQAMHREVAETIERAVLER